MSTSTHSDPLKLRALYDWTLSWAERPSALGALMALSFAESSFFPIPPDVLLLPLCLSRPKRWYLIAAYCTLFSVLGGLFGYGIGFLGWGAAADVFYQYVPGFSPEKFARVQVLYEQWGAWVVFSAGFSPIPYKVFTITSGVMEMPIAVFIIASVVGRGLRFFLVGWLVAKFGEPLKAWIERYFNLLALAAIGLLVLGFGVMRFI